MRQVWLDGMGGQEGLGWTRSARCDARNELGEKGSVKPVGQDWFGGTIQVEGV